MNTLFVGSIRSTDTSLHYFSALTRLGHCVCNYDPRFFETNSALERLERKVRRGPTASVLRRVHKEFISLMTNNRWDLVFVMGQNFFSQSLLLEAREQAGSQARFVFHSHDNLYAEGILKSEDFFQTLALYDFVFTTKSQNLERYRSTGQTNCVFLPSAYEPSVHRPISKTESRLGRSVCVSFIGTYDFSRDEIANAVGWERLEVWGDGWNRYATHRENGNRIHPQAVYYFQFADITSHSQIALGLLRKEAGDLHTQRTFEIPACGAFQLAPRNSEILSFFKEGQEIECFGSLDELKNKLDFYLAHESERKRIAEGGYRRVTSGAHTYQDRVQTILRLTFADRVAKLG